MTGRRLEIRGTLETDYGDVLTPEALAALEALAGLDADRKAIMAARIERRAARARNRQRITFLDPEASIPRTRIRVQDARDGKFVGSDIPRGPAGASGFRAPARPPSPNAPWRPSIRNVAHALLSGADGWMFDGEDALGQVSTMSLDNQRNLKLAIRRDPVFLKVAEQVARRDERLGAGVLRATDRSPTGGSSSTSRRRSSGRAGSTSTTGTSATRAAPGFSASIVDRRSTS